MFVNAVCMIDLRNVEFAFIDCIGHDIVGLIKFLLLFLVILEIDLFVTVLDLEIHAVLFFNGVVNVVDDSSLDFVFNTIQAYDLSAHQVV